jgi:hypothetical protein
VKVAKRTLLMAWVLAACIGWWQTADAQDTSTQSSEPSQTVGSPDQSAAPQDQPDTHPLGGAYLYSLGSAPELQSYLQTQFSIGQLVETSPYNLAGHHNSVVPVTFPMGSADLMLLGTRNDFGLRYGGAGFIYDNGAEPPSSFHIVSLMDVLKFRRGSLSFTDLFSFMPEAEFGLPGIGVLGGLSSGLMGGFGFGSGSGMGQVNPAYTPNEGILTNLYGAYSNTALVEGVYELTAKTSISAMGTFGVLQFAKGAQGLMNGNDYDGLVGLNHKVGRRSEIGVSYLHSSFHYVGLPVSFDSQALSLEYGLKITGKLGLQVFVGPELVTFRSPPNPVLTKGYYRGTVSLAYATGRNDFSLYGGHYSSGGGGVVPGAETTTISAGWHRRLTRIWTSGAYFGYSRNSGFRSLSSLTSVRSITTGRHFQYWFTNLTLNRPVDRYVTFYAGYEYQRQATSGACTGSGACAVPLSNQVFGIGFSFTPHPFAL